MFASDNDGPLQAGLVFLKDTISSSKAGLGGPAKQTSGTGNKNTGGNHSKISLNAMEMAVAGSVMVPLW